MSGILFDKLPIKIRGAHRGEVSKGEKKVYFENQETFCCLFVRQMPRFNIINSETHIRLVIESSLKGRQEGGFKTTTKRVKNWKNRLALKNKLENDLEGLFTFGGRG